MSEQNNSKPTPAKKTPKKKGIIRTEAIIPFVLVVAIIYIYFHFFFDTHLKKAIEWGGYQALGAEINVGSLETSFFKGTIRIQNIQVTNAEKPSHNSFEIGDVRFGVLWDGLLRAKLVVEEMAVEQIKIDTVRKSPGKVKPPDPEKESASLSEKADALKDKALNKVEEKYDKNLLGDIAALLGGTSGEDQLGKLEGSLASKARLKELETEFQAKKTKWEEKIKTLPKPPEIQALGDRLSKVKIKDFKTPQELQTSVQEIDSILKEADAKYKLVQSTGGELSSELKAFDQDLKNLDAMVKQDIKDLESRFRIPKLDAKSISQSIFYPYMAPYIAKFNRAKELAEKYVPPKYLKKKGTEEVDQQVQPHPRADGITYEFGRPNSYPLVWVKKISISSQAGASADAGDVKGLVTDVTTNQSLIGKPTVARIDGNFPSHQVSGFKTEVIVDNRAADSKINYLVSVGSYALAGKELVQSPDVQIAFAKANGALNLKGELVALRNFKFSMDNKFTNVDYTIAAKEPALSEILTAVFKGIPMISLDAWGEGQLPEPNINLNSNLGPELAKGFERQIQAKINEAKVKLQAFIDESIGKEKAKFEAEVNKFRSQFEAEKAKVEAQINGEKAKGEAKVNQAKKDAENQAKKGLENEVKKALGKDGDKQIEDLKKKFGL